MLRSLKGVSDLQLCVRPYASQIRDIAHDIESKLAGAFDSAATSRNDDGSNASKFATRSGVPGGDKSSGGGIADLGDSSATTSTDSASIV